MKFKDRLNPIGLGMNVMTKFAHSTLPDRLGVRKYSEEVLQVVSRETIKLLEGGITNPWRSKQPKQQDTKQDQEVNPAHLKGETKRLLDFSYSEDQTMVAESLTDFAMNVMRPAAALANESAQIPAEIVQMTQELGLASFVVPESMGGSAASPSPITSAVVIESLAKGDLSIALGVLGAMSVANIYTTWGTAVQKQQYLPMFLAEQPPVATLALNEAAVDFEPLSPRTTAKRVKDGWVLNGRKCLVPMLQTADFVVVAAQTDKAVRLFMVRLPATGVSITASPAMGLKAAALADIEFKQVRLPADACIGDTLFKFSQFMTHVQLAWCAMSIGTANALLDYVIPYCNERVAFGEPISHRQAVAFMISNIAIELESMRVLTQRALSLLEQGKPCQREAFLARLICADKSMEIATNGVQLLGGHGFTKEHPVERWYRDLRAVSVLMNGLCV